MNLEGTTTISKSKQIRLTEFYVSVQGESTHFGKPCLFIRLSRCNLRCTWCDSAFTFTGGTLHDWEDVAFKAHDYGIHTIEITGGEPLLQPNVHPLMQRLLDLGHEVLLETSGSLSIAPVPKAVHIIADYKCPGSNEHTRNDDSNLALLKPTDELKFVIAHREDFEFAQAVVNNNKLDCILLFSPAFGLLDPATLIEWILESKLRVRFQMQMHKYIWPPDERRV